MPDKSLSIIDLTYRLVLDLNRAVGALPRNQRPGLGRRIEAAGFDLLEALVAARYHRGAEKQAMLASASQALDRLRLLIRMAFDLRCLPPARYEEMSRESILARIYNPRASGEPKARPLTSGADRSLTSALPSFRQVPGRT